MLYSNNFTILDGLKLFCEPGAVYELRCPRTKRDGTISGYFDDLEKLAYHADTLSGVVPGVYLTINPVKPDVQARAVNRMEKRASFTTADHEIQRRCRLLLDFDPTRPAGVSSTDEEHEAALAKSTECRDWLSAQGFPEPILADSGNGGHLVYGVDLPNDDESKAVVENFLKAVAERFSDGTVKSDVSVFNAGRISKIYGTMACKGDNTSSRPHRLSRILEAPNQLKPVSRELLLAVGKESKKPTTPQNALRVELHRLNQGPSHRDPVAWVEDFLERHNIGVRQSKEGNSKWRNRSILE